MKLSREALSKIFNTFRTAYQEKNKVEPSADWQNRLMDEIRQHPPPARRSFRPELWIPLAVLLIVLLYLIYAGLQH